MRLIITRHGETEENALGITQGHMPGTLSRKGIEQADKVALRLKDEHIDYIYSSDLARARDTALKIAKYHPATPLELTSELRERCWGELEGKGPAQKRIFTPNPKGAETKEHLFNRAITFVDRILKKHRNDTVLIVGHGSINKAIILHLFGKGDKESHGIEEMANTGLTILSIDEKGGCKIDLHNCIRHL